MFTDQMDRTVNLPKPPSRIISLVPSQTELLFSLGLEKQVVGRTKFCIHPKPSIGQVQSVGGTKKFRFDVIDQLQPDLILGNKEENYQDGIARLAENYPVWMSDIKTLPDAIHMIEQVGLMTGKSADSHHLTQRITTAFESLPSPLKPLRVGYFIWQKPFMVVAQDTFIDDMLSRCGFTNVFAGMAGRYPEVSVGDIISAEPDALFLSSEPFPFAKKHQNAIAAQFPNCDVRLVDGELFSWYGSRLVKSVDYFATLISELGARSI